MRIGRSSDAETLAHDRGLQADIEEEPGRYGSILPSRREGAGMSTDVARGERSGWIEFSAVVLFAVAFFRIIEAIAYFEKSHKLNDLAGSSPTTSGAGARGTCASPSSPSSPGSRCSRAAVSDGSLPTSGR